MLEGLRRTKGAKDQRLPITAEILTKIINKLSSICSSLYETRLFTAAYTLAYHGFLRVGELVYTKQGQTHQILSLDNVQILKDGNFQFIRLHLQHSKCDQVGKGTTIDICQTDSQICPVKHLRSYLALRPNLIGPLFCHFDGSGLSRYQFCSVLTKTLKVLGIDSSGYKSHSFRIGAASDCAAKNLSEHEIMKKGRWKSAAYKSYIRL